MKYKFLFILLIVTSAVFSQERVMDASVNFRKNKKELSKSELKKLDLISDSIRSAALSAIVIKGFTDSDADSLYNYKLSAERCTEVKEYLLLKGANPALIQLFPMGEELTAGDDNEELKLKNRRVDILLLFKGKEKPPEKEKPKSDCDRDTTVVLEHGVIAVFKVCEYRKKKDCIRLKTRKEVRYQLKMSRFRMKLGLKKYYKVKKKHISYTVNFACKDTSCGNVNVSLQVPFFDVKEKEYKAMKFDSVSMSYKDVKGAKIKNVQKKRYITVPNVNCNAGKGTGGGCDYFIGCGRGNYFCSCNSLSRLKMKGGLKIITVNDIKNIEDNDNYSLSANKKVLYFNPDRYIFSMTLLDGNDTINIRDGIEISALKHGLRRTQKCSKYWLLFFQFHEHCDTYRKYKFKRKDIELQRAKPWAND